jgi:archaellum biogenesis ATPase FlaH
LLSGLFRKWLQNRMNDLLPIALRFLNEGISVVPVADDGSKRPALSWQKYQAQLPTADEVLGWFNNDVQGIGVITGAVSGNLEMLELEGRAVAQKMHLEIAEIASSSGLSDLWNRLNSGYVEMTPSGGLHWLYRVNETIGGNTKLARKPGENGGVDVWAETRSEGGFTITAPSGGSTHPSGGSWVLIGGSIETIPQISMSERAALHNIFAMFDEMPKAESIQQEVVVKHDGVLTPGDDYNARTTWEELLQPLGWTVVYRKGEATVWRRPGKSEGISATTNFNGNDKFYVFSTSTQFEAETSYSKFAFYATINHYGDFKAAANDLRNQGYGAQSLNSFDLSNQLMPTSALDAPTKPSQAELSDEESSWKPIALKDYYDGLFATPIATMLKRTDGNGLIYTGRVHSIYGESESGKSWVAQIASAECLKSDKKVIYIDFESDAVDIVNRLKSLGVSRANLLQYFTYIRPDGPRDADDPYWQAILESGSAELIIIDGVTESLTMWGGETKDNDAITRWMRIFPRTVATASGAAVVLIDHITKNAETRGRFAIGGQAKLATIDGAAYLVEPLEALAPGRVGSLTMRVTKDRPGFIRKIAGMWRKSDRTQEAAVLIIDSTKAQMQYAITVPLLEDELESNKEFKKSKEIVEFIHNHPGCTRRLIQEGVQGSKESIGERISDLIAGGLIANRGNDRSFILYITDEGKSHFNLMDAQITELKVN